MWFAQYIVRIFPRHIWEMDILGREASLSILFLSFSIRIYPFAFAFEQQILSFKIHPFSKGALYTGSKQEATDSVSLLKTRQKIYEGHPFHLKEGLTWVTCCHTSWSVQCLKSRQFIPFSSDNTRQHWSSETWGIWAQIVYFWLSLVDGLSMTRNFLFLFWLGIIDYYCGRYLFGSVPHGNLQHSYIQARHRHLYISHHSHSRRYTQLKYTINDERYQTSNTARNVFKVAFVNVFSCLF